MSVKLREAAAAKLPLGALNPARLWPLAGYAAALAAGFFGAGGRMFGGMCPLGLCAVVAAPACTACPLPPGRRWAMRCGCLSTRLRPILWRRPYCAFGAYLPVLRTTQARSQPQPWGPWPSAPCAWPRRWQGAKGWWAIALAAAQGMLIVGLGAALGACARWVRTAQSYARAQRAALCILYMALGGVLCTLFIFGPCAGTCSGGVCVPRTGQAARGAGGGAVRRRKCGGPVCSGTAQTPLRPLALPPARWPPGFCAARRAAPWRWPFAAQAFWALCVPRFRRTVSP